MSEVVKLKRYGHVSVTWRDAILVWGGRWGPHQACDETVVCLHLNGKWMEKKTTGNIPTHSVNASATIMDDKMFVVGGYIMYQTIQMENSVHFLDLKTWTWTKLNPNGVTPSWIGLDKFVKLKSWSYEGKIYVFGGRDRQQMLICYNVSTNDWDCPIVSGDSPSLRQNTSIILREDTVFLFGGEIGVMECANDLHILSMKSMRWKLVHGSYPSSNTKLPCPRTANSLTLISQSAAVLYGGVAQNLRFADCWLLNLDKAIQLQDPSSIWRKVNHPDLSPRSSHSAVMDIGKHRLWLLGGYGSDLDLMDVLLKAPQKITLSAVPLKVLAAEYVAKSICKNDPRFNSDQFSKTLGADIEACRNCKYCRSKGDQERIDLVHLVHHLSVCTAQAK